jgi:catechol-2,3-dioxygenase
MNRIGILETCLYVNDLDSAERFYVDVLDLPFFSRQEGRHCFLRCGNQMLLIFNPTASSVGGDLPRHGASGDGHMAFGIPAEDLDRWRKRLAKHKVEIEQEVEWPSGGISLYFRDPAGNSLEVTTPAIWGIDEQEFGFSDPPN